MCYSCLQNFDTTVVVLVIMIMMELKMVVKQKETEQDHNEVYLTSLV